MSHPGWRRLPSMAGPVLAAALVAGAGCSTEDARTPKTSVTNQEPASSPMQRTSAPDSIRELIQDHEARIRPLEIALQLAWWNANTTGKDEDFAAKEEAQNRLDAALADTARFAKLKATREALANQARAVDPDMSRQIQVLYLQALEKQVDPELLKKISARSNAVEKAFNLFRANVAGESLADSEVRKILKESKDPARRRAVWEASKQVGAVVEKDLKELVALRNEAAKKLGFKNYHVLQLESNEQTQQQVLALFDELERLTRPQLRAIKGEIDAKLAADCGIAATELRPWHYHDPFLQEAPAVYETDLDAAYEGQDIPALCRRFYEGIGLPIDDVLQRSDLYEKEGKSPHAFCTDIDRQGDVRVLANIVPNEYWMGTMLHELGHAVYSSKNIPASVPYVIRTDAHILATEGMAMLFERFSKSAAWLQSMGVEPKDPAAFEATGRRMHRNRLLIFAAWCQVMLRFEVAMYDDPDQDLNKLWWDLVEKYQEVRRPEGRNAPDYGSKIHIVSAPAYYHNYLMGELFACQLHHAIARNVLKVPPQGALYTGKKEVGAYLQEKVFALGRRVRWDQLSEVATGEPLGARAFAEDLAAH